jgi:subtilisin family serine protease
VGFFPPLLSILITAAFFLPGGMVHAQAGMSDGIIQGGLLSNPRLIHAQEILADFAQGKPDTGIIVTLRPLAAASALSDRSRSSVRAPAEFERPGAPPFYNLQDRLIREELRAIVEETVSRAVNRLGGDGLRVTRRFSYQFGFAARITPAALQQLAAEPEVLFIEKDRILFPHLAQGIPLMHATVSRAEYDGSDLSIVICDTGIDTSHPHLGGGGFPNSKVIGGYDFGDNDADPRPDSVNGDAHGTACAGIAAGDVGTFEDYIGGVAPGARLYAVKISSGDTGSATTAAMIAGWEWAVTHMDDDSAHPVKIISTSFGGGKFSSTCDEESPSMTDAAFNALAAGITIFASSGNDGYCDAIAWPACISTVNSVGAVYDGSLGTFGFCIDASSCAPKEEHDACSPDYAAWDVTAADMVPSYSNSAPFLTLLAPSHNAFTTDIVGGGGYSDGDYDPSFGGTSAAAPYAAGAAAVLQSAAMAVTGTFLSPSQIRQYLVNTGDSITDGKVSLTKPRINLDNAVTAFLSETHTLTVTRTGTGSGTVFSDPGGIDCGADCSEGYAAGTTVTLTAVAEAGSSFTGWSGGGCGGTDVCTVTIDQETIVAAEFTTDAVINDLTVLKTGTGLGTVFSSPGGIDCGTDCSEGYAAGTIVILTAVPDAGDRFKGWVGNGCAGTGSCVLSMDMDRNIAAEFTSFPWPLFQPAFTGRGGLVDETSSANE